MAVFCTSDSFWYDPAPTVWLGGNLTPPPIAAGAAQSGWLIVPTGTDPCGHYGGDGGGTTVARDSFDGPFISRLDSTVDSGEGPWATPAGDLYCFSFGPSFDSTDPEQNLPDPPSVVPPSLPDIGDASIAVEYVYLAIDATDGTKLGDLPLADVQFSDTLTGCGTLTASLPLTHDKAARTYLEPKQREITVVRNGVVVWNGPIVWTRRSKRDQTVQIRARQASWYLYKRTLEVNKTYTSQDLFDVVRDLVSYATSKTGGTLYNFGVSTGSAGATISTSYDAQYRQFIGQMIEDLAADPTAGFDFRLDVSGSSDIPITRTLRLGAPTIGSTITGHLLEPGAGMYDLTEEADLERAGNRVHILPGLGFTMSASNTGSLAAGDPLIEYVLARPDDDSAKPLVGRTLNELRRLAQPPVRSYTAAFIPRAALPYDWCDLGDLVGLKDPDMSIDATRRVTERTTSPPRDGAAELVSLSLGLPLDELGS